MSSSLKIQKAHRTLLMIAMFSIVMLFAGLTSAYIVSKGALGDKWDMIILPTMFYWSTVMIVISSISAHFSVKYAVSDKLQLITRALFFTILFGILFLLFQILGWYNLVNSGKFLSGNNVASSYLYVITFTHLGHLIGGLIALLIAFVKSINKKYNSSHLNGLRLIIRFWHFLGILWIYLFLFLLFLN